MTQPVNVEGTVSGDSGSRRSRTRRGKSPERRQAGRLLALTSAAVILGLVAVALLPSSAANVFDLVSINGRVVAVPPSATIDSIAGDVLALARPGSTLDLTGDVTSLGEGGPALTEIDGSVVSPATVLTDGDVVTVRHGTEVVEGIARKTESLPFRTAVQGDGDVVSLEQTGRTGERMVYFGVRSGKQAASFVITPAQDTVIQRTNSTKPGQKLVALTFDDGPGKWTQGVLDALAASNAPATFFMLGSSAAGNKSLVQAVRAAGHEVENHSWSHPILTELTPEQIRSEITRTSNAIGGGRYLRPPYGIYDSTVSSVAHSLGYRLALWNVDTLDWKYPDVDSIMSYVKAQTKPGAIILMHDGGVDRSQTIAAIPKIVDWLLRSGYTLTTVQNLL